MEFVQLLVAGATAAATVALVWVTHVLARETTRLSDMSSRPMIVAVLEPSPWAINHVELIIENTGNAAAFAIDISIQPEIEQASIRRNKDMPLKKISILRPSQSLKSYLCEAKSIIDKEYIVTVSWQRQPISDQRESITYNYDMRNFANLTRLGSSPGIQIAEQIKHLRDDWKGVAGGAKRIEVDSFSSGDRESENADLQRRMEEFRSKNKTE